ncbi:MAternally affected uncoordination [Marchantia polymorpha subsp. ruderalis]|uniref:MalT-like TPR region domain-containing protein n=2 Tax=Marchantia polymorpha TaxID=3197 RepID=A0AAF6BD45_MARPO|nr:hypothetical protein MARPO_0020s0144 [Marchantia polymorpha]BBN09929.1 hypothetical protein Mp_4g23810 [Marchantia polymorpha subsp. ruderalis]|eukprot:PTQ44507.1 hypothetical protein MARPO_0020s0144 [Marchantia polymorpha]
METVAEGLWSLADRWEEEGRVGQAVKCLEAICQSHVSFLPITDVKTRLRIASLLLRHTDNVSHAKSHLERAQLLLKQIPACYELKCRAYSLLSRCYNLLGTIQSQKQTLRKGLDLAMSVGDGRSFLLWACNFNLQLANALTTEGDYQTAIAVLESGLQTAEQAYLPDLQMVFATSVLHVNLMQWEEDAGIVEQNMSRCETLWNMMPVDQRHVCKGLYVYKLLLQAFFSLRTCDYKEATYHVASLDTALADDTEPPTPTSEQYYLQQQLNYLEEQMKQASLSPVVLSDLHDQYLMVQRQLNQCAQQRQYKANQLGLSEVGKLPLGPAPLDEEWLPRGAVLVLVDLLGALCLRPKGMFKECSKRIDSGLSRVDEELNKLGVTVDIAEGDLQHWAIWIVGIYLVLWLQLLENKAIIDLTQTDILATQETLVQILECHGRFSTMLQGFQSNIHMLLGHYSHTMGCYQEAVLHFGKAFKMTGSKGMQAMSQVNAALSYICVGDLSQALDLIAPVYKNMDSYVGVREKTSVLFASGLLQMKQNNLQEARTRLATGLTLTHKQLGNHQLLSQYLTVLGSMATTMHDTGQARDILKSSFTLAKALHDLPTQLGVLSELTVLFQELGETSKQLENAEYEARKTEELKRCIGAARDSKHHTRLIQYGLS